MKNNNSVRFNSWWCTFYAIPILWWTVDFVACSRIAFYDISDGMTKFVCVHLKQCGWMKRDGRGKGDVDYDLVFDVWCLMRSIRILMLNIRCAMSDAKLFIDDWCVKCCIKFLTPSNSSLISGAKLFTFDVRRLMSDEWWVMIDVNSFMYVVSKVQSTLWYFLNNSVFLIT